MDQGQLFDADGGALVVRAVQRTNHSWERLRGLLGRSPLLPDAGLLLDPCNSVHTCFMSYAIDVVYLDRFFTITRIVPGLRPWCASYGRSAHMTLDLAADSAARSGLGPGQRLRWQPLG